MLQYLVPFGAIVCGLLGLWRLVGLRWKQFNQLTRNDHECDISGNVVIGALMLSGAICILIGFGWGWILIGMALLMMTV